MKIRLRAAGSAQVPQAGEGGVDAEREDHPAEPPAGEDDEQEHEEDAETDEEGGGDKMFARSWRAEPVRLGGGVWRWI